MTTHPVLDLHVGAFDLELVAGQARTLHLQFQENEVNVAVPAGVWTMHVGHDLAVAITGTEMSGVLDLVIDTATATKALAWKTFRIRLDGIDKLGGVVREAKPQTTPGDDAVPVAWADGGATVEVSANLPGGGGTDDHRVLSHRNDADQHTTAAVTGLDAALAAKATTAALAAEAVLARNGDNVTSGTVADARIAATIARDSEVAAAVAAEALLARNGANLTAGPVPAVVLGSGSPSSATFLRGDNIWAAPPSGWSGNSWKSPTLAGTKLALWPLGFDGWGDTAMGYGWVTAYWLWLPVSRVLTAFEIYCSTASGTSGSQVYVGMHNSDHDRAWGTRVAYQPASQTTTGQKRLPDGTTLAVGAYIVWIRPGPGGATFRHGQGSGPYPDVVGSTTSMAGHGLLAETVYGVDNSPLPDNWSNGGTLTNSAAGTKQHVTLVLS